MYCEYFGLREIPFAAGIDTRFLFSSQMHFLALAVLRQATGKSKGYIVLTGTAGTGKTLLCQASLDDKKPETTTAAIIAPQGNTAEALLESICKHFVLPTPAESTLVDYHETLFSRIKNDISAGKPVILVIDNAHILQSGALLALHKLVTADYGGDNRPSIILSGQPELIALLAQPELAPLKGMLSARATLSPLEDGDIRPYIRHRLGVAGAKVQPPFSAQALKGIFHYSQGVPGRINAICDRAMADAAMAGHFQIDAQTITASARKLLEDTPHALPKTRSKRSPASIIGGAFALIVTIVAAMLFFPGGTDKDSNTNALPSLTPTPALAPTTIPRVASPTPMPRVEVLPTPVRTGATLADLPDPSLVAPQKQWIYDSDGVARVSDPAFTPIASLFTLARLWKRPFSDEELGMFRSYKKESILSLDMTHLLSAPGVDLHSFETAPPLTQWLGLNLPLALEVNDRSGRLSTSVVLTNIEGDICHLADPRLGNVRLDRSILEPMIERITVVYSDADNLASLKPQQSGDAVRTLENILATEGFWVGEQTGTYGSEMRTSIAKLQNVVGLIPSGNMDDATAAHIAVIRHTDRPVLRKRQKSQTTKIPAIH